MEEVDVHVGVLFDDHEDNHEGAAEEEEEGEADQQDLLQATPALPQAGGSDPVLETGRYKHRPAGEQLAWGHYSLFP